MPMYTQPLRWQPWRVSILVSSADHEGLFCGSVVTQEQGLKYYIVTNLNA